MNFKLSVLAALVSFVPTIGSAQYQATHSNAVNVSLTISLEQSGKAPDGYKPLMSFATASPDFQRVAFTAENKEKRGGRLAVIDGVQHPEYLIVNDIMFSPDSTRVMYKATPAGRQRPKLYLDGKLLDMEQSTNELQFTKDSKNFVYVSAGEARRARGGTHYEMPSSVCWNGSPTKEFSGITKIRIGGNSKTFSFTAVKNGTPVVVVNNEVVGRYRELPDFPFTPAPLISPDGKRYAYPVKNRSRWMINVDGKEGPQSFAKVHAVCFSPDSAHYAFAAEDYKGFRLFQDGNAISEHYQVVYRPLTYSPDSNKVAAIAKNRSGMTILVNGKPTGQYGEVGHIVFSPNSKKHAHWATRNGSFFVVLNGVAGKAHSGSGAEPTFSPNSSRLAYTTRLGKESAKKYQLIVNEKVIDTADEIAGITFSPNSQMLAYWARDGKQWHLCVDGQRSKESFTEIVGARPNQIDFEDFVSPPKMMFATNNKLLAVGVQDDTFYKITMQIAAN